jgi:hypothetical protein
MKLNRILSKYNVAARRGENGAMMPALRRKVLKKMHMASAGNKRKPARI